jgi:hypothetical protein
MQGPEIDRGVTIRGPCFSDTNAARSPEPCNPAAAFFRPHTAELLEEVNDLPHSLQTKLLDVLQRRVDPTFIDAAQTPISAILSGANVEMCDTLPS